MSKFESGTSRIIAFLTRSSQIPPAEGISPTNHFTVRSGALSNFTGLYKLCCAECRAMSVLIEHKPVSCRSIYGEYHITGNSNICFVFIDPAFSITGNMTASFFDRPTHERMFIIRRRICHVDSICNLRICIFSCVTVSEYISANRNIIFIQVIYSVLLCQNSIVSYFIQVCNSVFQFLGNGITNVFNRQFLYRFQIICCLVCPPLEDNAFRQGTHTRIVKDRAIQILIFSICLLHKHGSDFCVIAVEFHFQACVLACRNNSINREPGCFKSEAGHLIICIFIESCSHVPSVRFMDQRQFIAGNQRYRII